MSYLALTGRNPRANVQNNCKRLWIKYTPAEPVEVPLGQEFDISLIFPNNPRMDVNFQTRNQGTFDVMSRIPLSLLCALYGLEGNKAAYILANSNQDAKSILVVEAVGNIPATAIPSAGLTGNIDAVPPTSITVSMGGGVTFPATEIPLSLELELPAQQLSQFIESISFAIDLFPNGRIFNNGDLLDIVIADMPSGASVDVSISDYPYMSTTDKPHKFRLQTVLANNDFQVDFKGKLIFPNDPAKVDKIQMQGNVFVQWDLLDFYANADSDLITNKTTYNSSPYIFLDTANVSNVKFKALAEFAFYYKSEF